MPYFTLAFSFASWHTSMVGIAPKKGKDASEVAFDLLYVDQKSAGAGQATMQRI
jgi:hypothetical protein